MVIRAIYENGVFRPLDALEGLREQTEVHLQVKPVEKAEVTLADFAGLLTEAEADELAAIIEQEFERIDPSEW